MAVKIRWLNPVGACDWDEDFGNYLAKIKKPSTTIEVVSLDNPHCKHHLEYHSYEGLVTTDIVRVARDSGVKNFDAMVIGCFYDPGLREAREIAGRCHVVAPCQASVEIASNLSNKFSVLVGRQKWVQKMTSTIHDLGYGKHLASVRPVGLGVEEFQADHDRTASLLIEQGKKAVNEDFAEALILGCTLEFGFYKVLQDEVGVPVIDCSLAAFKRAEQLAELSKEFGWEPSRVWSCEAPPDSELLGWNVFASPVPIGNSITY